MPFKQPGAAATARTLVVGVIGAIVLMALAACSDLPRPHIVEDAPGLAHVAELLKLPLLRPLPEKLSELRPPYPCGKSLFLSMQFAPSAGVVYFAGPDRYALLDIGTGETILTGAGEPLGRISANGRVLAIPVEGGIELREAETGVVLVLLPGATGDEFDWVGDFGIVHMAPPAHAFAKPRLVYRDLQSGLETSLAAVDRREPKYILDFGVISVPGREDHYLQVRDRLYRLTLTKGDGGTEARLGHSMSTQEFNPARASLFAGGRLIAFENEAVVSLDLSTFAITRTEVPGLFIDGRVRTADPDRILVRVSFKDDAGGLVRDQEMAAGRHFYYSVQRNSLAPVPVDVAPSRLTYLNSMRSHFLRGDETFQPYDLPAGGEEGDAAKVLAEARSAVLAEAEGP